MFARASSDCKRRRRKKTLVHVNYWTLCHAGFQSPAVKSQLRHKNLRQFFDKWSVKGSAKRLEPQECRGGAGEGGGFQQLF